MTGDAFGPPGGGSGRPPAAPRLRVVSGAEVARLVSMRDAIDAMASAFAQLSAGDVEMPARTTLSSGAGASLFMPARTKRGGRRGAKVVSLFPTNRERGLPTVSGVVLMVDDETGSPTALVEAAELTAIRTAAAAGLAAKLLSGPASRVLAVFGAGAQAPRQIEAIRAVRPIEEVRVVSKRGESARRLASALEGVRAIPETDPARAVRGADVVVAATTASRPLFDGSELKPGAHVSGSGSYRPDAREIGSDVVARARVVVEERRAALEEAGDLILPIKEGVVSGDVVDAELGEIAAGTRPEGRAGRELTFFKSVGVAVQDVAMGALALARAEAEGAGVLVDL